jgi:hypothetical protein
MGLTMQNLRDKVRKNLGSLDSNDSNADDTAIDLLINSAWWEFCDKVKIHEKEKSTVISTVAGVNTLTVPTDLLAIQNIAVEDPDSYQFSPLDRMTVDYFNQIYNANPDQSNFNAPTGYFRRGNTIYIDPTPDQVYSITIWYGYYLADLAIGNNPSVPQAAHEIVLYGASWRGCYEITGDHEKGDKFQNIAYGMLSAYEPVIDKEVVDTHRGGVGVRRRGYR